MSAASGDRAAPEEMIVGLVPGEYFSLLGIQPVVGRLFTEQEVEPGKQFVAAISQSLWRSRFELRSADSGPDDTH